MASAAIAAGLLVGCQQLHRGVNVPGVPREYFACPVALLRASDLPNRGESGCSYEGSTVLFPNGDEIRVGAVGTSERKQRGVDGEIIVTNWGVPGIGAVEIQATTVRFYGTTQDALELEVEALVRERGLR